MEYMKKQFSAAQPQEKPSPDFSATNHVSMKARAVTNVGVHS
jgi:hypothetical protein